MHHLKIKRLLVAVSLVFAPLVFLPELSYAAGLGKLRVNSGLGEPLSAEIDVLSASNAELDSLEAKIASDSVYESQGIERPSLYNAIRVEVKKKSGGAVLKLSSAEAITEPFLDMLIQMDWGSGQLLREYNLLLDPPGYNKQKNIVAPTVAAPKEEPVAAKSEQVASVATEASPKQSKKSNKKSAKKAANKTAEDKSQPEKVVQSQAPEATATIADDYKTKSGDSLSNIAKKSLQDGVNLDQYMVAMFRANQSAFTRQNINRLKVGQIVKVPSIEEAKSIAPTEARKEIVLHSKDWNSYKNNLAEQVAQTSGKPDAAPVANQSAGKISTKAEEKTSAPIGSRDVVKLSKSDTKSADENVQNQVAALQDELAARDSALKESNTRSAMLEKRISDMEKLLTLKNQGMAELQKGAAAVHDVVKVDEANKPVESKPETLAKPETESKPTEKASETPKTTEAKPNEAGTEPQYTNVVASPPVKTEGKLPKEESTKPTEPNNLAMFDSLLVDPMMLGGAAGGLALLGGVWFFVRNKRKRGLDNLEKAIQTTSGLKENTVFGNTEGASIGSGTTSFLTDFSQSGGGMIDTHDVDPIAEAEVYMAYGRDVQAEEILKDAIVKDPKRSELHLKLLELYAGRKDTQAFETVAGELYSTVGVEDPAWSKAAILGRGLEPNNPLYQTGGDAVVNQEVQTSESSPFVDGGVQAEEIEYSLESGESEDVQASDAADTNAIDADFAAIESIDFATSDTNDMSQDLEFSLDDNQTENLDSVAVVRNPSFDVADDGLLMENDLSFSSSNQQSLGNENITQPELADVVDELIASDDIDLPDTSVKIDANEIDFPDFSGLEVSEVDEQRLMQSEQVMPSPSSFEAEQLASLANKTQDKLAEIDLNLPDVFETSNPEKDASAPESNIASSSDGLDTTALDLPDFDLPEVNISNDNTSEASALPEIDLKTNKEVDFTKIDLDLGVEPLSSSEPVADLSGLSDEFNMEPESSEVETKLDLVTAYIDMGDQEGARELLEEVVKEGGPQQRLRAQEMLKSLS